MFRKLLPACMLFGVGFLFACNGDGIPKSVDGWKPVYKTDVENIPIQSEKARSVEKGGKIYVKDKTLYQVEQNKGIHVIDITQASQPQMVAFISLPGASEISIRDQYLYSNSYDDLIVLNIADIHNVSLAKRIPNTFAFVSYDTPPSIGYFECVDNSKGVVVDWEFTTLHSPQCKF